MTDRTSFLAGDRPSDIAVYLHEQSLSNPDVLSEHAEAVEDGLVLVLPGDDGRSVIQSAAGFDPMALAQAAMDTTGDVAHDLTGGTCPAATDAPDESHTIEFVFAFAEAKNEAAGGLYAEGDVIHAYAACECGERFSEKWIAEQ